MFLATMAKNRHARILRTVLFSTLRSGKNNVMNFIFFNRKFQIFLIPIVIKVIFHSSMISYFFFKISNLVVNQDIFLKATLSKIIDWYIIC